MPHLLPFPPSAPFLAKALEQFQARSFSYDPKKGVGFRAGLPFGYNHDVYGCELGNGADTFYQAKQAIQQWKMFPTQWAKPWPKPTPIKVGETVLINFCLMGLWGTVGCRIISVVDEEKAFGFTYGTLSGHVENGEEQFLVKWREDNSVWYQIEAFSRPGWWPVWMVYPFSRAYQRRFGRQSCATMQEAIHKLSGAEESIG